MRKWIEQYTVVHYCTRSEGNNCISFSEFEASSDKEAISLAKMTRNIRKINITGIEVYKSVVDLDKLKIAMHENESNLPHESRCICFKCTGKDDSQPPTNENWKLENDTWILPVRITSF